MAITYTKFHDNTIETKFVKQLVSKTNVPFISTWRPGDFAIRGMLYITNDAIWKCMHTGHPLSISDTVEVTLKDNQRQRINYFYRVSPYVFGQEYYNITGHYLSNSLGYDATTHFYLGQYLRMMRDLFNLDLMPFYNCFCGESITNLDFIYDSTAKTVTFSNVDNEFYKIYSVPVRFGQTYTIGIDSDFPIEVVCVVYGQNGIIENRTHELNKGTNNTYYKYNKMTMRFPSKYKTKDWEQLYNIYSRDSLDNPPIGVINNYDYADQKIGQYERSLRLLIKVPITHKTSIVVIEGDYSIDGNNNDRLPNVSIINSVGYNLSVNSTDCDGNIVRPSIVKIDGENGKQIEIQETLLSPLGLLQMSDGESYAFSNRLIEYLLQNVINPLDDFGEDTVRVQKYIKSNEFEFMNHTVYRGTTTPGVWDNDMREFIYNSTINSKGILSQKVDLTGFVDKDTETIVTKGQGV